MNEPPAPSRRSPGPLRTASRGRTLSLRSKGVLVLALPGLAVLLVLAGTVEVERQSAGHEHAVDRTIDVDQAASRLLTLVIDAETGVRGYVATGDEQFLEPETKARRELPAALARVEMLLAAQEGTEPTGNLRQAVARDLRALDALRRLGPVTPGRGRQVNALAREGKAATDAIRAQIAALQEHERRVHAQRDAAREHSLARTTRWAALLAAMGLLGGFGASALLMARLVRRIHHVQGNATRLASGEPLVHDVDHGHDELDRLAAALDDAAELISDQRRRLRVALEVGRINVWEVDASGQMRMQGDRAGEYGPTFEAGLATVRPEHAQQVRAAVSAVRQDGVPRDYEVQSARDGRWFAGRVMRASDTDIIAVSVDVTALRQAQEELRRSEIRRGEEALAASEQRGSYNALVLGSAGEGIASIGPDGTCLSANPAAARLLGYEVAELVGQDIHALCHHSYPDGTPYPASECLMRRAAVSGESAHVDHEVFWRRDGTRLPVAYTVSPITDAGRRRGAVVTFTDISARRDADEQREQLAATLRGALRNGELVLHYQPKVDLVTGACESVEALVRWQRKDRLVYPDEFITAAEQCGVIGELTQWVVDAAAGQVAAWSATGLHLRVAVNLSALSLVDESVIGVLMEAARTHGIPVSQLEVELTESAAAENPEAVVAVLARLASMNVRSAIDDFGTGFSSLSYLKHLPVSTLKVDKSFVMNLPSDTRDQAIVASTVHMAHSLGMTVVAEGVENEVVLRILRHAMCDAGQGYHWTRPLPAPDLAAWAASLSLGVPGSRA